MQAPLREWAYVMWDRARLDAWIDFTKPWEYVEIDAEKYDRQENIRRDEEEQKYQDRAAWLRRKEAEHNYSCSI